MLNVYGNKLWSAKKIIETESTPKWNLTIKKQNLQKIIKLPLFLDLLSSLITYARSKLLEVLIPFPCKKDKNPCLSPVFLKTVIIT